jgi:hypothetical protein
MYRITFLGGKEGGEEWTEGWLSHYWPELNPSEK